MALILTNLAKVINIKSYKQNENIILNISFDRKNPRFSHFAQESIDLKKHILLARVRIIGEFNVR